MNFNPRLPRLDLKKDKTAILTVLAVILGILTIHSLWLGPKYLETEDLASRVENQEKLVLKYRRNIEQGEGLREKLEKQEGELKILRKGLFQGSDPYQLAASLGELLSPNESRNLSMKSYQVLDSKEYDLYQEVRLKFYFTASIQGLHQFLKSLEGMQMVLGIEEMDIRKGGGKDSMDLAVNVVISTLTEKGEKLDKSKKI